MCYNDTVEKLFTRKAMQDKKFKLVSPYSPTGDQPEAIDKVLVKLDREKALTIRKTVEEL